MNIEQLTAFLGWCTVVNVIVLFLAGIGVMSLRNWMTGIHSSMFGVDENQLANQYFQYLANYKIAIFVFNLAPYLALRILQ